MHAWYSPKHVEVAIRVAVQRVHLNHPRGGRVAELEADGPERGDSVDEARGLGLERRGTAEEPVVHCVLDARSVAERGSAGVEPDRRVGLQEPKTDELADRAGVPDPCA